MIGYSEADRYPLRWASGHLMTRRNNGLARGSDARKAVQLRQDRADLQVTIDAESTSDEDRAQVAKQLAVLPKLNGTQEKTAEQYPSTCLACGDSMRLMSKGGDYRGIPTKLTKRSDLSNALICRLKNLKGTTVMMDSSRPQAPFERLNRQNYELMAATGTVSAGQAIPDCSTGACPVR